jgi:hypothetical protein
MTHDEIGADFQSSPKQTFALVSPMQPTANAAYSHPRNEAALDQNLRFKARAIVG